MTDSDAWIAQLKVGDKVMTNSRPLQLATVTRITATQVHTGYDRWRKSDGRLIGAGTWNTRWLRQVDEEVVRQYNVTQRRNRLGRLRWDRADCVSDEQVARICALLDEGKEKEVTA